MDEIKDYDARCKDNEKRNQQFLQLFKDELMQSGLSPKTINRHLCNVELYLNDFLTWEDVYPMEQGPDEIGMFLGYYFIKKCMWSTPATIKSTAASLKKFYKCMAEHKLIPAEKYSEMAERIKNEMDDWCADCDQYNDLHQDSPFSIL